LSSHPDPVAVGVEYHQRHQHQFQRVGCQHVSGIDVGFGQTKLVAAHLLPMKIRCKTQRLLIQVRQEYLFTLGKGVLDHGVQPDLAIDRKISSNAARLPILGQAQHTLRQRAGLLEHGIVERGAPRAIALSQFVVRFHGLLPPGISRA
jgi:hypothetical protein